MLDVSTSKSQIVSETTRLESQAEANQTLLVAHSREMELVVALVNEMSSTAETVAL